MFQGTTAAAREQLERMTASAVEPVLSSDEITDLLYSARRADYDYFDSDLYTDWAATTVYALNAERVPTTRNGHYYKVTTAGTSGATEPTWPTTSGGTVVDGTATWTESGSASWTPTWDLNSAAADGWEWKANKSSNMNTFLQDGRSQANDYLYLNCRRQAETYRNKITQSIPVRKRALA